VTLANQQGKKVGNSHSSALKEGFLYVGT